MDTMKAAQLTGPRTLEIRKVPLPPLPADDQVLLKIGAVGICGSDIHYYQRGRIGDQVVEYPFTIGHECAATVEMCGPQCGDLAPGDRVAVDPAVSCGTCDQCRAGRFHTCRNLLFLGCPGQLSGCLAEFLLMPARNCYRLPENLSLVQAVLAEPLSIGIHAVDFLQRGGAGGIAILGAGPIGLSVLFAARATGLRDISVTDKIEARTRAAARAGAVWSGNPEKTDVVADILSRKPGLEAVFECCGDAEALDQAVELLDPGGILVIVGIPETDRVSLDIHRLRRGEIRIQNVRRQNRCTSRAIQLLSEGAVDGSSMITHTFGLDEAGRALETVSAYADGVIKAIVTFP
jgi:L-iditol 2-dehydrogenase